MRLKSALVIGFAVWPSIVCAQSVEITVPTFASAEEALQWGRGRLAPGRDELGRAKSAEKVLSAARAFAVARSWKDASPDVVATAAVEEAEAYLSMNAPLNALRALDGVPPVVRDESGHALEIKERAGEIAELLGNDEGAVQTYREALSAKGGEAAWRSLIAFRAGSAAMRLGRYLEAAPLLEEAAAATDCKSVRGVAARIAAGRCYALLGDSHRADAWLQEASTRLARGVSARCDDEIETFVRGATGPELSRAIRETNELLRKKRP